MSEKVRGLHYIYLRVCKCGQSFLTDEKRRRHCQKCEDPKISAMREFMNELGYPPRHFLNHGSEE